MSSPGPLHTRPPLARISRIHDELQRGGYPNCPVLAKVLEVTVKTVHRDIVFMRERLQMPIGFDYMRRGYYYTEPVSGLPTLQISEGEVFALLVAQRALEQYRGSPFEQPLANAFRKLSESLNQMVSVRPELVSSTISFRTRGSTPTELKLFETIARATRECRVLDFAYRKHGARTDEKRTCHPYHLTCYHGAWYFVAFDKARNDCRTFALARVKNATLTQNKFTRPANFDPEAHFGNSFGIFASKGAEHVVQIRFSSAVAPHVCEKQWHRSQIIKQEKSGTVLLTLRVGRLEEVESWVLGWGAHATVLAPKALSEAIRTSARAMMRLYGSPRSRWTVRKRIKALVAL